jgi:HAD superfamily hydrolase (TIGR01509 family)
MSTQTTRAVIFDLDGVIADSEALHVKAWRILFAHHGLAATEEEFEHGIGLRDVDWLDYLFSRRNEDADTTWWQDAKREVFRGILEREGRPFPGADGLIAALSDAGLLLAVASNSWRENIETMVRKLAADHRFRVLTGHEDVTRAKPAPDIYLLTAERLGVDPAACVVIEDSPVGIQAAKAAGMRCVGVTHTLPAERLTEADMVVASLTDADAILRFVGAEDGG